MKALTFCLCFIAIFAASASGIWWTLTGPTDPIRIGTQFEIRLKAKQEVPYGTMIRLDYVDIMRPFTSFGITGAGGLPYCLIDTDPSEQVRYKKVAGIDFKLHNAMFISFGTAIEAETEIICPLFLMGELSEDGAIVKHDDFRLDLINTDQKMRLRIDYTPPPAPTITQIEIFEPLSVLTTVYTMSIALPEFPPNSLYQVNLEYSLLGETYKQHELGTAISYADYNPHLAKDVRVIVLDKIVYIWTGPHPRTGGTLKLNVNQLAPGDGPVDQLVPMDSGGKPYSAHVTIGGAKSSEFLMGSVKQASWSTYLHATPNGEYALIYYAVFFYPTNDGPTVTVEWTGFEFEEIYNIEEFSNASVSYYLNNSPTEYPLDITNFPTTFHLPLATVGQFVQLIGHFSVRKENNRPATFTAILPDGDKETSSSYPNVKGKLAKNSIEWEQAGDGSETLHFTLELAPEEAAADFPAPIPFSLLAPLSYARTPSDIRKFGQWTPKCMPRERIDDFKMELWGPMKPTPKLDLTALTAGSMIFSINGTLASGMDVLHIDCMQQLHSGPKPTNTASVSFFFLSSSQEVGWKVAEYAVYNQLVRAHGPPITNQAQLTQFLVDVATLLSQNVPQFSTITPKTLFYQVLAESSMNSHRSEGVKVDFNADNVAFYSSTSAVLQLVFNRDPESKPVDKRFIFAGNYEVKISTGSFEGYIHRPVFFDSIDEPTYHLTSSVNQSYSSSCWSSVQCYGKDHVGICVNGFCKSVSEVGVTDLFPDDDDDHDEDKDGTPHVSTILIVVMTMLHLLLLS